jgi:hypothetical protein
MTLSGGAPDARVLIDLFRSVLAHVGVRGEAGERLLDQLMTEHRRHPGGDCTLHFTVHAGEIEIALSQAGVDWRTSCPVPVR